MPLCYHDSLASPVTLPSSLRLHWATPLPLRFSLINHCALQANASQAHELQNAEGTIAKLVGEKAQLEAQRDAMQADRDNLQAQREEISALQAELEALRLQTAQRDDNILIKSHRPTSHQVGTM